MRELKNYKSAPKAPVKFRATNFPSLNKSARSTGAHRNEPPVRANDHEPLSPMAAFANIVIESERSGRIDENKPLQALFSPSRSPEDKVQKELLYIDAITDKILREAKRVIVIDNAMTGIVPAHLIAYDATVLKILKRHSLRRGIPFWIPKTYVMNNGGIVSLGVPWI